MSGLVGHDLEVNRADRALPFSAVRLVPRELANNHYAVALASDPAVCTAYPHWSTTGKKRRPGRGSGSRVGDDQHDDRRVQHEAEHGDPVVRMALLGLRVALQRGQHAQQDRQHGEREPDRD